MADELNFQIPPTGFDSYLNGIIPESQAITAGAFSVALQQIRNITKVSAATFARVVYSLESTKDLPDVNGTDVPTDKKLATAAKAQQGLGSGVYGTYTLSNYFGAMSGLPYFWKNIYDGIKNLETTRLKTIYKSLYDATTATQTSLWPGNNTVVQNYITQANTEITNIKNTSNATAVKILNTYYDITGIALKHEQRARFIALSPVPVPFDKKYASKPSAINSFVDAIPGYASDTLPHMTVQTLENISDIGTVGGQSIIALLRETRNQSRLAEAGITLDDNMPAKMDTDLEKKLMLNGTIAGAVEGINSENGNIYTIPSNADTEPYNYYDNGVKQITDYASGDITPIIDGTDNPIVNNLVPSGPGDDPPTPINPFVIDSNVDTFPPPDTNSDYIGTTVLPSIYNVSEAIAKVIECNCDCWIK